MPAMCIAPRCMLPQAPASVFCAQHVLAPAGRRGGWISAQRKKQKRGSGVTLDASNITRRLWVGSAPPFDRDLPDFDVVILCAQEIQPRGTPFHGRTIHCPLPDSYLTREETRIALMGGHRVAEELAAGKRVLVTCAMGRNRSALVAAFGMGKIYRLTPGAIIETIRQRRHADCLSNPHFVQLLNKYSFYRRPQ